MATPRHEPNNTAAPSPPRSGDRGRATALVAARVIEETRGTDVVVLDLRKVTDVFDYFVIATGTSRRQMHAMADEVKHAIHRDCRDDARSVEGYEDGHWIVMDYGDVVIHLFDVESREYWDLENLWSDAPRVPLPAAGVTAG
ncbi:MAG: ribosome silencing factor [Planctomycetia bacterium]